MKVTAWRLGERGDIADPSSVGAAFAEEITVLLCVEAFEIFMDLGMAHRRSRHINEQILLGHISHIFRVIILGEQMIERLVTARAGIFRNRTPPFLGVAENRINIEDYATERKQPVLYDLADLKLGCGELTHGI